MSKKPQVPQQNIYRPSLNRPVKRSIWNALSPLLIAALILAIVFAWVVKTKRDRQAEEMAIYNEQVNFNNKAQREEAERIKAKQKEDARIYRENQLAKKKAQQEIATGKEDWLRKEGVLVKQSMTRGEMNAGVAVDGKTEGTLQDGGVTFALPVLNRKELKKEPAWWQVDLGANRSVNVVNIYAGSDPISQKRLSNYKVILQDKMGDALWEQDYHTDGKSYTQKMEEIKFDRPVNARFVKIQLLGVNAQGDAALNLSEVEVFGPKVNENDLPSEYVD